MGVVAGLVLAADMAATGGDATRATAGNSAARCRGFEAFAGRRDDEVLGLGSTSSRFCNDVIAYNALILQNICNCTTFLKKTSTSAFHKVE